MIYAVIQQAVFAACADTGYSLRLLLEPHTAFSSKDEKQVAHVVMCYVCCRLHHLARVVTTIVVVN
jgi:hypothetical protein